MKTQKKLSNCFKIKNFKCTALAEKWRRDTGRRWGTWRHRWRCTARQRARAITPPISGQGTQSDAWKRGARPPAGSDASGPKCPSDSRWREFDENIFQKNKSIGHREQWWLTSPFSITQTRNTRVWTAREDCRPTGHRPIRQNRCPVKNLTKQRIAIQKVQNRKPERKIEIRNGVKDSEKNQGSF